MPIGVNTNLKLIPNVFYAGMMEELARNISVFNENSLGAIRLTSELVNGFRETENFFKRKSGIIRRRVLDSTSAITPDSLEMADKSDIKLDRNYYFAYTLDSLTKHNIDNGDMSRKIGANVAEEMMVDYIASIVASLNTSLKKDAATFNDITGAAGDAAKVSYDTLIDTMSLFGDSSNRFVAMVMHSKPFFKLFKDAKDILVHNVAGVALYEASIPTLNLPILVTDTPELVNVDGGGAGINSYNIHFLTEGAGTVKQSQLPVVVDEVRTGTENLVFNVQGEFAYNLGVKGFSFNTGITNPTSAELTSGANWTSVYDSPKSGAGVVLEALI